MRKKNVIVSFYYRLISPIRLLYWSFLHPRTYGVKMLIESDKGFLFVRNTYGHHTWTFPGGSKKPNETAEEAAIREGFEETGIKVGNPKYFGSYYNTRNNKRDSVFCFYAFVKDPEIKIDHQEISEFIWFPDESIPESRSKSVNSIFEMYKNVPRGTNQPLKRIFSRKSDGNMRMRSLNDPTIRKNQENFLRKDGVRPENLVRAAVCHSTNVRWVGQNEQGKILEQCDGLLTRQPGTFLAITAADCLPIFVSQPSRGVVGLIHAGWRGLAQGIVEKTVEQLQLIPADTEIAIGPAIHQHHYPVDRSVAKKFSRFPNALAERDGKIFLDLIAVTGAEWISFGVRPEMIQSDPDCTACHPDRYFSYRRDHPATLETMLAVTGQRPV